jgi:AraC family L-rhamnose operon regulatory protein RhaS
MEITYTEKGLLEWMTEGVLEKVKPGSIYFTLPWQVHGSMHPREPENTVWHVLFQLNATYARPHSSFRFHPELGFSAEEQQILSTELARSSRHCFPATPTIRYLMPALITELQSAHVLRGAHTKTLLRAILVELKRIVAGESADMEERTQTENRVQHLIDTLPERCEQPWTLSQMADHCGIQRTQINAIFQKLTGATPMEYLFRIRMERAKTLLRETDIKIIDIAFDCGYGTSQYFANTFKQATGSTPSEYRMLSGSLSSAESIDWKNIPFRSEEEERRRVQDFIKKDRVDERPSAPSERA